MTRTRIAALLVLGLIASLLVTVPAGADEHDDLDGVLISETANGGLGGSFDNYVQLTNFGDEEADLDGWEIYRCFGSGNLAGSPQVPALEDVTLEPGDSYLIAHDESTLTDVADALYSGNSSLANGGFGVYVADGDDVVDRFAAHTGNEDSPCAEGEEFPTSLTFSANESYRRIADEGNNATDFEIGTRTVGSDGNGNGEDAPSCEDPTPISDINEVNDSGRPDTGMSGDSVAVTGVVTANFLDGLDGFFVQDEDGHADVDSSHGVFVYHPGAPEDEVAVGDEVCVSADVGAFSGTVQLTSPDITELATGQELPAAVDLVMPVDDRNELARLAGMRVELTSSEGAMTVTQNYFQGQFGELDLSATGRLWNPTELHDPIDETDEAWQLREDNLNSWIKLDDASSEQNPSPTPWLANGAERAGAQTADPIAGITHYQHGSYRVQPTAPDDITFTNEANPRPDGPPDVLADADEDAVTATVAGFNVLNYFTTLGSRGASTEEELELQAAKIVTAITKMDADVVGLMEIENNFGEDHDALQDLLARLNAVAGAGTYAAVGQDERIGNDAISNAMIYKPDAVTPVGKPALSDHEEFVDPRGAGTERNRPAVTQAFEVETGDVFVAAVNHLKSKGSGCGEGDDDPLQGSCNGTRTDAAEELVRWLDEEDPTGTGAENVTIIGDLNAYAQEDPNQAILGGGYQDALGDQLGEVYTYVFDGEHGRLDHALVSDELADHVVDAQVWHINTDEPAAFDYRSWNNEEDQDESEFRSSDHDPILLGLQFEALAHAELDEPRGRIMAGRTNVVPFTVVDGAGEPLADADLSLSVELDGVELEQESVSYTERDEPGTYHAHLRTDDGGAALLTVFDSQGNAIGSTELTVAPKPGGGGSGR